MGDEKTTETKAEPAGIMDDLTGNSTEDGAKTENGEVVTETTEKDD
jgi:hypothetical protein